MGQDPNQPYPGQYGQPGGVPPQPQPGAYPPPPSPGYQQPNTGYQQPNPGGYQYQQQGYQQFYGQPGMLYYVGHPNGATSINMEPNTAAGLSYFTWIAGLIFFLLEKQNRFVRFNAMQEILLTATVAVCYFVASFIPFLGWFLFIPLIGLAGFACWLLCVINAFQGRYFKLPVLGDYAERIASSGMPPMPM